MPGVTALVLLMFIAVGCFGRCPADRGRVQLRKRLEDEWLLGLSGVLSVLFGGLLVAMPAAGLLSLAWVFRFRAVLSGVVLIALAFRLRRAGKELSASRVAG